MIRDVCCGSRIHDQGFFYPGARGKKIPGSPIRIHNTGGQGKRLRGGKKVEKRDNCTEREEKWKD